MPIYPPYVLLCQVLEHCPKAGATFMMLWADAKDKEISYQKQDITIERLLSWSKFRSDLRYLAKEGAINIKEYPQKQQIEIQLLEPENDVWGYV